MIAREGMIRSETPEKIWHRYCGFLDLSLREFMEIQEGLLREQIELVEDSPLGRIIMKGNKPRSVEEFRKVVPLTTYWKDYAPHIGNEPRDDMLAIKPVVWAHTSGRGGSFKWIPWSQRALERYIDTTMASLILSAAERKGEVNITDGDRFLFILAPPPYISGISAWALADRYTLRMIPPLEIADKLEFQERIELGFKMALSSGADFVGAVSTALVKVGEAMAGHSQGIRFSPSLLRPNVFFRLLRAWLYSKKERRPMLPRDLWPVKGICCGGTDTSIYREQLRHYWGKYPYEMYGCTEVGVITAQSWAKKDMTFYPYLAFLEFIPEEEWLKTLENPDYQPPTLLADELEPGKIYEVVLTNFYGMPLLRYRIGDLIRVTALEEPETGIKLPQVSFYSRADGLIDLYGIVRLDEKTLWQAIDNTKVPHEDWSARKEYEGNTPVLRVYLEPKVRIEAKELEEMLHQELLEINPLYEEAIGEMETNPIRVTLLEEGSFQRYYQRRKQEGADLAHLKPPHMNAKDAAIRDLVGAGEVETPTGR